VIGEKEEAHNLFYLVGDLPYKKVFDGEAETEGVVFFFSAGVVNGTRHEQVDFDRGDERGREGFYLFQVLG
jgi:hypothetical protein